MNVRRANSEASNQLLMFGSGLWRASLLVATRSNRNASTSASGKMRTLRLGKTADEHPDANAQAAFLAVRFADYLLHISVTLDCV